MSKATHYFRATDGTFFASDYPELHKDCEQLPRTEGEKLYKEQYRKELQKWIKPGTTVYCVLRSVSSSGMSRRISFFVVNKKDGRLSRIDHAISAFTGYSSGKGDGLQVSGCGMDMGFAVVYDFGRALWPKGTPKAHSKRNGEPDRDGGYALKSEWI